MCSFCYMLFITFVWVRSFVCIGAQGMPILCINTYTEEQTIVHGVCQTVIPVHLKRFIFLGGVQRHRDRSRYVCAMRAETLGLRPIRSPSSMARKSHVSLLLSGQNARLRVYNNPEGAFSGEILHFFLLGQCHASTVGKPWR